MLDVIFVLTWLSVLDIHDTSSRYLLVELSSPSVDISTLPGPETKPPMSNEEGEYVLFTLCFLSHRRLNFIARIYIVLSRNFNDLSEVKPFDGEDPELRCHDERSWCKSIRSSGCSLAYISHVCKFTCRKCTEDFLKTRLSNGYRQIKGRRKNCRTKFDETLKFLRIANTH